MGKYRVNQECFCEGYLHEKINYPRPGLKERKLQKGDEVEHVHEWSNLYGTYIRVRKDGIEYDIPPDKLTKI
jgi:hypothetical protein